MHFADMESRETRVYCLTMQCMLERRLVIKSLHTGSLELYIPIPSPSELGLLEAEVPYLSSTISFHQTFHNENDGP